MLFGEGGKSNVLSFTKEGFDDWKNAHHRISEHKNSISRKWSVLNLKERAKIHGRVDHELALQLEAESSYWKNVLRKVIATIKKQASCGLPFRGDNEKLGHVHNGNFFMLLEYLSELDPFLEEYFCKCGNKGSSSTSSLSKTIYEELITIMSEKITSETIKEMKAAKQCCQTYKFIRTNTDF